MKKYKAMVLSCIDPRFQPKVYKYLKDKNSLYFTAKKFKKIQHFLTILSTSIKLHKIDRLIVINHKDCGAAKIVNDKNKFTSAIENKIHFFKR